MDKLIITVPDWVVCVVGLWFIFSTIESCVNIYFFYLNRKLERLERTTTSTVSYHSLETLLMAVETKYLGESKFETALKYIRERENNISGPKQSESTK